MDLPVVMPLLACQEAVVPFDVKMYPFAPIASLVALFVPLPKIKSPVVVIGDKALNAAVAFVCPVPPLEIAKVPDTVTTPEVDVDGVNPVLPKLIEVTLVVEELEANS